MLRHHTSVIENSNNNKTFEKKCKRRVATNNHVPMFLEKNKEINKMFKPHGEKSNGSNRRKLLQ